MKKGGEPPESINLQQQMDQDLQRGLENLEIYEKQYHHIPEKGMAYLREHARRYREEMAKIQELIIPAVDEVCSVCDDHYCRIHSPSHMVYTAGAPGGYSFKTFLLARVDSPFPEINSDLMKEKICPFLGHQGCRLPLGSRSLLCISWFCKELREAVNMPRVEFHLRKLRRIVDNYSIDNLSKTTFISEQNKLYEHKYIGNSPVAIC